MINSKELLTKDLYIAELHARIAQLNSIIANYQFKEAQGEASNIAESLRSFKNDDKVEIVDYNRDSLSGIPIQ